MDVVLYEVVEEIQGQAVEEAMAHVVPDGVGVRRRFGIGSASSSFPVLEYDFARSASSSCTAGSSRRTEGTRAGGSSRVCRRCIVGFLPWLFFLLRVGRWPYGGSVFFHGQRFENDGRSGGLRNDFAVAENAAQKAPDK